MDKNINSNGYEYVDLGLPSGTLWATMNVGASSPLDYGLYFQWGDTQGYTKEQVGIGSGHRKFATDWNNYKFGTYHHFTKYTSLSDKLELVDDAAHVHMGVDWHMPSPMQFQELFDNTTTAWTTFGNVNGMAFTSKKDESKFIFIPAAGNAWGGSVDFSEEFGFLWSSMLSTYNAKYGHNISFNSERFCLNDEAFRVCGMSIRGVIDKNNDDSKNKKSNMNENLNLVEILMYAPMGTKLWSPICGECEFQYIDNNAIYLKIVCLAVGKNGENVRVSFTKDGWFSDSFAYAYSECALFPSKENRDWSTFKVPKIHKNFEPYQKVLILRELVSKFGEKAVWMADEYSHYDEDLELHYTTKDYGFDDDEIMPYEGNEDKVGTIAK